MIMTAKCKTAFFLLSIHVLAGCGSSGLRPVEIFPEDMCANCRMAISDERFASEIITGDGEAFKFDDLGCLLKFRGKRNDIRIAATFLKDYETRAWIPYERATIVETDLDTPMGSGTVAFADAKRAQSVAAEHPAPASADGCCAGDKE
jgi:copper chaperone NosL